MINRKDKMNIELKILDKEFYRGVSVNSPYTQLITDTDIQIIGIPKYATQGSAGIDLVATKDYVISPQERIKIGTGIAIHIGSGSTHKQLSDVFDVVIMGMIVPRSGLGTKGLVLANTIGIIDEDYKSEIIISAWNSLENRKLRVVKQRDGIELIKPRLELKNIIEIKAGDRIAQLILMPIIKAQWTVVDEFSDPDITRGAFGSTGV